MPGASSINGSPLRRWLAGMVLLTPFLVTAGSADVIRLHDGTRYEGEIKRESDGYVVTLAGGRRLLVPIDKVAALEATPKNGAGIPEQRLESLRRAVANVSDLKQIIE